MLSSGAPPPAIFLVETAAGRRFGVYFVASHPFRTERGKNGAPFVISDLDLIVCDFDLLAGGNLASGSKPRTAARDGTMGCARADRRAADLQPRGRLHPEVWCLALRRCAQGTRFRQCAARRPFLFKTSQLNSRTELRWGDFSQPSQAQFRRCLFCQSSEQ